MKPNPYIEDFCQQNGWTDIIFQAGAYWAYPPGAVMRVEVPIAPVVDQMLSMTEQQKIDREWIEAQFEEIRRREQGIFEPITLASSGDFFEEALERFQSLLEQYDADPC